MKKKISIISAAMACVLSVIISSMCTAAALNEYYRAKVADINAEYNDSLRKYEESYTAAAAAVDEQMKEYGEIAADICEIDRLYRQFYPGELDTELLREYAIRGYIAGTGDRYGFYYSPEAAEELTESMNGETDGIGISVIYDSDVGAVEVISVYEESPAYEAGVMAGDLIAYILNDDGSRDSVAAIGYDAAVSRLRGKEGTLAQFVSLRDSDGDGIYEEYEFSIKRSHIETESVTYHIYGPDASIGVIRISGFEKNTPAQFRTAVEELRAGGVQKLIFDVRNNPGGDKDSVCEILDYLLPEGPLMRTVDENGVYETIETSDASFLDMPMAVLVNSGTASAGELFSAAIRDFGAGKLIGEQTFGKGSMQSIMSVFDDGSLVKLTVSLYCPPVTENYDGVGLTPDVDVPLDDALMDKSFYKYTDEEDNQLRAAAETLG